MPFAYTCVYVALQSDGDTMASISRSTSYPDLPPIQTTYRSIASATSLVNSSIHQRWNSTSRTT